MDSSSLPRTRLAVYPPRLGSSLAARASTLCIASTCRPVSAPLQPGVAETTLIHAGEIALQSERPRDYCRARIIRRGCGAVHCVTQCRARCEILTWCCSHAPLVACSQVGHGPLSLFVCWCQGARALLGPPTGDPRRREGGCSLQHLQNGRSAIAVVRNPLGGCAPYCRLMICWERISVARRGDALPVGFTQLACCVSLSHSVLGPSAPSDQPPRECISPAGAPTVSPLPPASRPSPPSPPGRGPRGPCPRPPRGPRRRPARRLLPLLPQRLPPLRRPQG